MDVQLGGGKQLEDLAKRLAAAASSDLVVQEIGQAMRAELPGIEAVIVKGTQRLPERGGLSKQVARTRIDVMTTARHGYYGLRIVARPNAVKDPDSINRGRVAHQAWGRWTKPLLIQLVPKGWFTEPIQKYASTLRNRLTAGLSAALRKV